AVITAFKAVVLEGLEVVFIVLAIGAAAGLLVPAILGALAACGLVVIVGCAVHRPLARIPENTLKFAVGVLLSAFGAFWVGEGLGFHWPGDDLAIIGIAAFFLAAAAAAVGRISRNAAPLARGEIAEGGAAVKNLVIALLILALAGFFLFRDEFPLPDDSSSTARDPGVRGGAAGAGAPIAGLTATELALFSAGKDDFEEEEKAADG